MRVAKIIFILFSLPSLASEISSVKWGLGFGTGIRAESQYSDPQPQLNQTYILSTDLRWQQFQLLAEWSRWNESSSDGNMHMEHQQTNYLLFGRAEVVRSGWIALFAGAGGGLQQDKTSMQFGRANTKGQSELAKIYGGELGLTFYLLDRCTLQVGGRLMSQPYNSRWTQWASVRLAWDIF